MNIITYIRYIYNIKFKVFILKNKYLMISYNDETKSQLTIKLNYKNEIYEISIDKNLRANKLREMIFSKFNLDDSYILTYKNQRLSKNDFSFAYMIFKNDSNPLLFINDNNTILPNLKSSKTITLKSNLSQGKLLNIINSFFISKNIPFNASINHSTKGMYNIKFNNPQVSSNFLKYYHNKIQRSSNYANYQTEKNINNKSISNIIRINNQVKLPPIKEKQKPINKTSSTSNIVSKNDKSLSLYNVIKENSKSDLISQRIIESGYNFIRQPKIERKNKIKLNRRKFYINEKYIDEEYESLYSSPFMSGEEKYNREKFLDKKNWLNKDGFIVSVGKYKMKENNFIPNYVSATPSESPLNHKYRDINKNKWINKSGFII